MNEDMKQGTLCILLKDIEPPQVLLGLIKRSKFQGKIYNFPGGKYEPPETMKACAARELYEETGLRVAPEALQKVAELTFLWPESRKDWNQIIHVYQARGWSGEPRESNELKPEWFPTIALPLENMWPADRHWAPRVLNGDYVKATFRYDEDKKLVEYVFS